MFVTTAGSADTIDRASVASRGRVLFVVLLGVLLLAVAPPARADCGDGIVDAGEFCDDGNTAGDDCCDGCVPVNDGEVCADASACSLGGLCDVGVCESTGSPCSDDANPCTDTICDERFGCLQRPNDAHCDDGQACNGAERCDPTEGCVDPVEPLDCGHLDSTCRVGICSESEGGCTTEPSDDPLCDADGDGVLGDEDPCPLSVAADAGLYRGCGTFDLVRDAAYFFERIDTAWNEASAALADEDELAGAVRKINGRVAKLGKSAAKLAAGRPCKASERYDKVLEKLATDLEDLVGAVDALVDAKRLAGSYTDASLRPGDAAVADSESIMLLMWSAKIGPLAADAQSTGDALRSACTALDPDREQIRGTVVDVDDLRRVVELDDGSLVQLPERKVAKTLQAGSLFKGTGYRVGGEDLFVAEKASSKNLPSEVDVGTDANWHECLSLEILPVQPLPPFASEGGLIRHALDGYRVAGRLELEQFMQFAVAGSGCTTSAPGGKVFRYSMSLVANSYIHAGTGKKTKKAPIALDLLPGERAALPYASPDQAFQIEAVKVRRVCELLDPTSCKVAGTKTDVHPVFLSAYGDLCEAEYSTTEFGLEDVTMSGAASPPAGVAQTAAFQVTGATLSPDLNMPDAQFAAEAYVFLLVGTSYPTVASVGIGDPLAMFRDSDFYTLYRGERGGYFQPVFDFLRTGLRQRAGLRWPRVEGTRNGRPARYGCRTPEVTLDRIHEDCYFEPRFRFVDTYYRVPFRTTWSTPLLPVPIWKCGNCNIDDPGEANHDFHQAFAFDLDAPEGTELFAMRGGVVQLVRDDYPHNQYDCYKDLDICIKACIKQAKPKPPKKTCVEGCGHCDMGNYFILLHDDGTYGSYFHLVAGSVLPHLDDGVRVRRGEKVALVGNTGNSSNPHVHVDVNDCQPVPDGFQENMRRCGVPVPMYFEASHDEFPLDHDGPLDLDLCYLPTKADPQRSSNNCNDAVGARPCPLQ